MESRPKGALRHARTRLTALALACALAAAVAPAAVLGSSASRGFKPGDYAGKTSQHLAVTFTLKRHRVKAIDVAWKASCSDGRSHSSSSSFGAYSSRIEHGRFEVKTTFASGGTATFKGSVNGTKAHGKFSRGGPTTVPGLTCDTGKLRWSAKRQRHAQG